MNTTDSNDRDIFVIHGRNKEAREAIFAFLRSIGLNPLEWSELIAKTRQGSPHIWDILDKAFEGDRAVIVLLTPDEIVRLHPDYAEGDDDPECQMSLQARPNVLFEAGLAMGKNSEKVIFVEFGLIRPFSDISGRHTVKLEDTPESRNELVIRLKAAGCTVNTDGTDWIKAGDFNAPSPEIPNNDNLLSDARASIEHEAEMEMQLDFDVYFDIHNDKLYLTNSSELTVYNIKFDFPEGFEGLDFPEDTVLLSKLPSGNRANFPAYATLNFNGRNSIFHIICETESGEEIRTEVFLEC